MNIEITRPEVEALIKARLLESGCESAEEIIFEALQATERGGLTSTPAHPSRFANLSDLLLNSPFAGADLDLERSTDQPRSPEIG
jgi:hypothetical protein